MYQQHCIQTTQECKNVLITPMISLEVTDLKIHFKKFLEINPVTYGMYLSLAALQIYTKTIIKLLAFVSK